ncbi:hypothetical protein M9Y10_040703 [Tritrichomonas musculus]|uniref:Uncharacterized protein n=1 Tax=Tritrichomonas musculus TaxID=1915356 RepID=A0ABR2K384_9EUKA
MLFFLYLHFIAPKVEVTFSVKYTAACPIVKESFMIIDEGKDIIKPPRYGKTYYRFKPGKHFVEISHPWCTFYNVSIEVHPNGRYVASTHNLTLRNEEIPIRHLKNIDTTDIFQMLGPSVFVIGGIIFGVVFCCKKMMNNPQVQEEMRRQQEKLLEQQKAQKEELKRQKAAKQKGNVAAHKKK